jgi:hypothetical protein
MAVALLLGAAALDIAVLAVVAAAEPALVLEAVVVGKRALDPAAFVLLVTVAPVVLVALMEAVTSAPAAPPQAAKDSVAALPVRMDSRCRRE